MVSIKNKKSQNELENQVGNMLYIFQRKRNFVILNHHSSPA